MIEIHIGDSFDLFFSHGIDFNLYQYSKTIPTTCSYRMKYNANYKHRHTSMIKTFKCPLLCEYFTYIFD